MDTLIKLIYMFAFGTILVVGFGFVWDAQMRKQQRDEQAKKEKERKSKEP